MLTSQIFLKLTTILTLTVEPENSNFTGHAQNDFKKMTVGGFLPQNSPLFQANFDKKC